MVIIKWILFIPFFIFCTTATCDDTQLEISEIKIEKVFLILEKQTYRLSGDVSVSLESTLLDALKKGVALEFISEFKIIEPTNFFFKRVHYQKTRKAKLTYHGITRRFTVVVNQKLLFFESLTNSLAACLSLKDWISLPKQLFVEDKVVKVKLRLDTESLPKPLALVAAKEPAWNLSTGWINVDIKELEK